MTLPKIKTIPEYALGEIGQSMNLRMALLQREDGDNFTQLTPHVKCRDFLCDVYSSDLEQCPFGIYGMKGLWPQHPDWTGVYLHLLFPNDKAKADFKTNLVKLLRIEAASDRCATYFVDLGGLEGFIQGDKAWLANTLNFSLYTFLLRVLCYELPETNWIADFAKRETSDSKYVASIDESVWKSVVTDLDSFKTENFCGLSFKDNGTGSVHHNSGFISVFGSHTEINRDIVRKNAHWKEMKARGFKLNTA